MDGKRRARRISGQNLAVWLLSLVLCCGTSVTAVYFAFDRHSLARFLAFDGLDFGIGLGLATTLIVGICSTTASKSPARRIAMAVGGGLGLPALIVWLWYCAWAANMD